MGETGETYLVGSDMLMRSDSRFSKESTLLKQEVDTETVRAAIAGESGIRKIEDYRKITVPNLEKIVEKIHYLLSVHYSDLTSEHDFADYLAASTSINTDVYMLSSEIRSTSKITEKTQQTIESIREKCRLIQMSKSLQRGFFSVFKNMGIRNACANDNTVH